MSWTNVYHNNLYNAMFSPDTELRNHTFTLICGDNQIESELRNFRLTFAKVMADWTLKGGVDITPEMIELNPNAAKFGTRFAGFGGEEIITAYGPRILRQIDYVANELTLDPASRRANIMILSEKDQYVSEALGRGETNCEYICTNGFNFYIRNGELNMSVSMRSNNYLTTVCQDVFVFMELQNHVADMLGLPTGRYEHHAMSGHVLPHERIKAVAILESHFGSEYEIEELKRKFS